MEIVKGAIKSPWKVCLYGTQGLGKSSIGAAAPKPLMFDLEKGLDRIEADKTPYITKYSDLVEAMIFMATSDYQTAVFDTLGGIEKLLTEKVISESDKEVASLSDFGYGKGFELLALEFNNFLDMVDRLVVKGKNVLIIAHDTVEKFESPTDDSYDRYTLRTHKRIQGPVTDRMDAVLFAKYKTFLKPKGEKDFAGNDKKRGIGAGERIVYCEERPAWLAKNRFNLGEHINYPALDNLGSFYDNFK